MARAHNRGKRCSTERTGTGVGVTDMRLERTILGGSTWGNKFEELPLVMTPQQIAVVTGEHVNSMRRGIT